MSGDSITLKISHGSKASKHGSKPAKSKHTAEEEVEVAPEGEVPNHL